MSQRVKSQQELEQEQADARLAADLMRQEQQQLEQAHAAQQQQQHPHAPASQQPSSGATVSPPPGPQMVLNRDGVYQVTCPLCMSINNIHPSNVQLQHMCGTCRKVLPQGTPAATTAPATSTMAPPSSAAPQQQQVVRCPKCSVDNLVSSTGGAFSCGRCGERIGVPSYQPPDVPAPSTSAAPRPASSVIQAQAVEPPRARQLEVRCGRCPAINQVTEDPRTPGQIQFKCGSCGSLNKAAY